METIVLVLGLAGALGLSVWGGVALVTRLRRPRATDDEVALSLLDVAQILEQGARPRQFP